MYLLGRNTPSISLSYPQCTNTENNNTMPHIVVLFLHTFCEQIHFQPFLPTEYLYTLIFWVYKRISGWLFWKSIHFIQDETFENEFLYHLFFLSMYWSRVEITVNSAVKLNLDAHWQLNHFDSLHTKQESKLTFKFFLVPLVEAQLRIL